MEHEADEGDKVHADQSGLQPLIVLGEAAEAGGPGETALHDPASRQEHEASFGFGQLDHLQADAVLLCGLLVAVCVLSDDPAPGMGGRIPGLTSACPSSAPGSG